MSDAITILTCYPKGLTFPLPNSSTIHLVDVAEEVADVLRAGELGQMAEDDDTVKTVVYQGQQVAKQLLQRSPSVPSFDSRVDNKIIGQRTDGDQNFK